MKRDDLKRTIPIFLALTAALGCGPEPEALIASGDADQTQPTLTRADSGIAAEALRQGAPEQLSCVTEVAGGAHEVLRLEVWPGEDGPVANLRGGKQFRSHESGARYDADVEVAALPATLAVEDGGLHLEATDGDQTLSVDLRPDGMAFRGELVHDECYQRQARQVTCWDPLVAFGGFGGTAAPGMAAFDWETGRCVDEKGNFALNRMPIEMIRETGMGDCADLRNVALNGEDFGYPSLSYWALRGADLSGAQLFFADLENTSFHGTNMSALDFGYATITGSVTDQTRLPESGCERDANANPWSGPQLVCAR